MSSEREERDQRIVILYRSGLSLEAVGFEFDLTGQRVAQILRRLAEPVRKQGRPGKVAVKVNAR